jgi:flagellar protein FlaI
MPATKKVLESYRVNAAGLTANVSILSTEEFVPIYSVEMPEVGLGTKTILNQIRMQLIKQTTIKVREILDPRIAETLQVRFIESAKSLVNDYLPSLKKEDVEMLSGILVNDMLGLGNIEIPLNDENLEEVVINNSAEPIWVYHRRHGWLKSNVFVPTEDKILDYANLIGRRIGRQITILNPLMDAHLITGDRVNATLFPVSTKGNTITVRKFARKPWTIVDFIKLNTISEEIAALTWLCVQYELNVLVSGGTGSGKTSTLNTLMPFIQPNQRIISIEDTRELSLPMYLHWIPMTTREPNPEGKGEVSMLDLMVNSLRMRPDRMVVGEIRRQREAEVLFEAMHTGHSVYSTLHADRAEQAKRRLVTPPIGVSESLLESLHLILVQYRHRRLGIRRVWEVAEVVPVGETAETAGVSVRLLYRWKPREDAFVLERPSLRVLTEIETLTGMTEREVSDDLEEKEKILHWMVQKNVNDINNVGKLMALYYKNKQEVLDLALKNKPFD